MFTIKHIQSDSCEDLVLVEQIRFAPGTPDSSDKTGTPPTVWCDGVPFTGGTIFVMNAAGKTVSRYDLGASPVPLVGDGLRDPRLKGLAQTQ